MSIQARCSTPVRYEKSFEMLGQARVNARTPGQALFLCLSSCREATAWVAGTCEIQHAWCCNTVGGHRQVLGGSKDCATTDFAVESLLSRDRCWFVPLRFIDVS